MLDAYRDLIDELLETPTVIRAAIAESQDGPVAGQIATDVALIRDRDLQIIDSVRAMMQRNDALIDDSMPSGTLANSQTLDELMGELDLARGDLVSLLINLSLKDWERTAISTSGESVTLSDMIEEHVEFDETARMKVREIARNN